MFASFLMAVGVASGIGVFFNFFLATYFVVSNYRNWGELTLCHYVPVGALALISIS